MQEYSEIIAEAKRKERKKLIYFLLALGLIICLIVCLPILFSNIF